MTEWTPKAGEDAVVRVVKTDGDCVWIEGVVGWFERRYLRPLPPALSAEDAAVLRAADKWAGDFIREGGAHDFMSTEAQNLISAVERRRRSTPPAAVAAFKVGDRVRDTRLSARMGRPIFGRIVEIDLDACAMHFDGDTHPQAATITPLADLEPAPDPEPATPRDTTALRDAVVKAVKVYREKRKEYRMNPTAAGDGAISNARKALDAATDALFAAEAPADPVAELREAVAEIIRLEDQAVQCGADVAGPVRNAIDRLRAALSALGDRGRG